MPLTVDEVSLSEDSIDPRIKDFPLVNAPITMALIIVSYLYFVLRCGPKFMENRPAYSLKTFIRLYNILQVIVNFLIVYLVIDAGLFTEIGIRCTPFHYKTDRNSYQIAIAGWMGYMLKIADLIDTIVFVLRKKNNQVSFLHVYHHITTLLISWICIRQFASGPAAVFMIVNCIVHTIMYTYYFLATFGPSVRERVKTFKSYLTTIQMTQFVLLILYVSQVFIDENCSVPRYLPTIIVLDIIMNFSLFYNFYRNAYIKPKQQ